MKKVLFFLIPIFVAMVIFFLVTFVFLKKSGKGTLQVTTIPQSTVYLNSKLLGKTPYPKSDTPPLFDSGDYTIRIVPPDTSYAPFESKVTITDSVLTAVDRTFGTGGSSEGSIISLSPLEDSKDAEILVTSFPEKAQVRLDNDLMGETPVLLKNIPESDHELKLTRDGYKPKAVPIRTKTGYKLLATVFLGVSTNIDLTITPTASAAATPTASASGEASAKVKVTILQTPTGFLRVRENPSVDSAEVTRVNPGDTFDLIDEKGTWYQIVLPNGKNGWILTTYAKKQ